MVVSVLGGYMLPYATYHLLGVAETTIELRPFLEVRSADTTFLFVQMIWS